MADGSRGGEWSRALKLAASQHGLVLRSQLLEVGVSARTLRRRIAEGIWIPEGRRVLRLAGTEQSLAMRSQALGMRVPGAVLTGPSAAALAGRGPWDGVALGTVPWAVSRARCGVDARFVAHPEVRYRRHGFVLVARPADAVVDLLRFLPPGDARTVAYRALQTGVVSVRFLHEARERLIHCAGVRQLARVVGDVATGAHSDAERLLLRLLTQAGITGWIPNHRVRVLGRTVVIDVAFPELRLALEVDGRAWHSDAARFQADRRRQNALVQAGWTVLRFTWDDLSARPEYVIEQIRECIRQLRRGS